MSATGFVTPLRRRSLDENRARKADLIAGVLHRNRITAAEVRGWGDADWTTCGLTCWWLLDRAGDTPSRQPWTDVSGPADTDRKLSTRALVYKRLRRFEAEAVETARLAVPDVDPFTGLV